MIVYLAGAIQAFVMYCVNGTSRSSLLIESTDSMIIVILYRGTSLLWTPLGQKKLSVIEIYLNLRGQNVL